MCSAGRWTLILHGIRGSHARARVQAHQAALEVEAVEQLGQDYQLAAVSLGRALGEDDPAQGSRMRNHGLNEVTNSETEHPHGRSEERPFSP